MVPPESMTGKLPKFRVLCLHGIGTNSEVFNQDVSPSFTIKLISLLCRFSRLKLVSAVEKSFTVHLIDTVTDFSPVDLRARRRLSI
jgi:hypothetical protein